MSEKVETGNTGAGAPILAQVGAHPQTGELAIFLNDAIPKDDQARLCLAIAQAFIGLAAKVMDEPRSHILVPTLNLRGPLQ